MNLFMVLYKILYRRARAWPSARASKGILHTRYYADGNEERGHP